MNLKQQFVTFPVDTERKLNVHNAFRKCPGRLLNVLCTFNLRPVSTGSLRVKGTWLGFNHLNEHKFRHNFNNTVDPICLCGLEPETTLNT